MPSTRDRVRQHRERLRRLGLRPVQIWVPDVRAAEFVAAADQQSLAIAISERETEDQAFVDAISYGLDVDGEEPRPSVARGEIYTAVARGPYTGKPRPVLIVQDDRFDATASITVCPFTSDSVDAPLLRIPIEPSEQNGLDRASSLMIDKITTMPKANLAQHLGRLSDDQLVQLNRSLMVFLGLASSSPA